MVEMIDPCATHNFISKRLIEEMKISMTTSVGFGVQLKNRDKFDTRDLSEGSLIY